MKKSRTISVLLLTILILISVASFSAISFAAQAPVNLRTTSTFAVMAATTITNTGTTVINGTAGGDVGLYPGSAFTGQGSVTRSGALHINDSVVITATTDLVAAYDDAAGRTPVTTIPSELGGTTLLPGVYASTDGKFQITGTLTLNAEANPDGVFVFLMTDMLNTATDSNVSLINDAKFCRVFWKVGSSATLGVNSHFVGHIFALTSISLKTGASVEGQILARNGAVTLDSNTISNGLCTVTPTLTPTVTPTVTSTLTLTAAPTSSSPPTSDVSNGAIPLYGIILFGSVLITLVTLRKNLKS